MTTALMLTKRVIPGQSRMSATKTLDTCWMLVLCRAQCAVVNGVKVVTHHRLYFSSKVYAYTLRCQVMSVP